MRMLAHLLDVVPQVPYQWSPVFLAPGIGFAEEFFHGLGRRGGFRMIQAHYTYCTLSFFYYYISFTSHYQTLDPKAFRPLP